jgi:phenylalanyl-tRNA synthetase beta chain
MFGILTRLGFRAANGNGAASGEASGAATTFVIPSWRVDVRLEEDLVEEVARHTGYEKVGSALPAAHAAGEYQPSGMQVRALRRQLAAAGFSEAINFSFSDPVLDDEIQSVPNLNLEGDSPRVELRNPIIGESVRMRTSLIPGLLTSLRHNLNHGRKDVRLFEIGRAFSGGSPGELPSECECLALLASGGVLEEERGQPASETDFYDLKGALEASVAAMRFGPLNFVSGDEVHLKQGQTASIELGGKLIGSIGRLSEKISAIFKFRQPVYVAELSLSSLLASAEWNVQYQPLARYPSVVRDVTLLVSRRTTLAELMLAVRDHKVQGCRDVKLVGTYEGANIPADQRSVTLRLEYRADDRTLRDEEVEEMHGQIVDRLTREFAVTASQK